jgi:hypothetical protein
MDWLGCSEDKLSVGFLQKVRSKRLHGTMIDEAEIDDNAALKTEYILSLDADPSETASFRRRRCKRGEWASAAAEEVDEDGIPLLEGDQGGWRWEWC